MLNDEADNPVCVYSLQTLTPFLHCCHRADGLSIEPEFYAPVIPMVLVNGSDGIGTGWSSFVPNYNPREIISNLRLMISGQEPVPMHP